MAELFHDLFIVLLTIFAGAFAFLSSMMVSNDRKHRNKSKPNLVDKHTRAGSQGKLIQCPHCLTDTKVYHFSWVSIVCDNCDTVVKKKYWRY